MQAILCDIRVQGSTLKLSLGGFGSFTVSDYIHTFPLKRVSPTEAAFAWHTLEQHEFLSRFPHRQISSFFDVVQIDAPISLAKTKAHTLSQIKAHLLTHPKTAECRTFTTRMCDYLLQNPPKARKPYSLATLREHLFAHPKVQARHYHNIEYLLNIIAEGGSINGTPDKTPKVWVPSPLPGNFHRGDYTSLARWRLAPKGSVVEMADSLLEQLRAGQSEIPLENRLQYVRGRSAAELRSEPMLLLDIEKPLFGTPEEEISWTAVLRYQAGETSQKSIYTLYNLLQPVNGYHLKPCPDESALVEAVAEHSRTAGATILVVYNAPYDTIQLREAGNFELGEFNAEPKKVATTPFFERIGVQGLDILDLLRWARIQYGYLPNQKLVSIGKHVLGEEEFSKEISYEEQAELERICKGMDPTTASPAVQQKLPGRTAPEVIASYVGGDVEVLVKLLDSVPFQHALEDAAFIGDLFHIDPFLLLHDAKRIQDYLERKFFDHTGTFADAVFPRYQVFMEYEQRVKERLKVIVGKHFPSEEMGIQNKVTKLFLPLGRALRSDLAWFFPEIKEFYNYVDAQQSPLRQFFLSQYEDALAEWMWVEYASFLYERDKFKHNLGRHDEKEFGIISHSLVTRLQETGLEDKLNKAAVAQKDLREIFTPTDQQFLDREGLNLSSFQHLFTQWSRMRQKNRILWGAYDTGWQTYEHRLESFCEEISTVLAKGGAKVIHTQGKYLYVTGKVAPAPLLLPVDTIKRAYVTSENIFYQRYGTISGFKRQNKPTFRLNLFEMDAFGDFLEKILVNCPEQALENVWISLDALGSRKIPASELVWQTQSSGKYRAFEAGRKIDFYVWGEEQSHSKIIRGKPIEMPRQQGTPYDFIEEPFPAPRGEIILRRREIRQLGQFQPDWEMYQQRARERTLVLVKPLLGKAAVQFVEDAISAEPRQTLQYYQKKGPSGQGELF